MRRLTVALGLGKSSNKNPIELNKTPIELNKTVDLNETVEKKRIDLNEAVKLNERIELKEQESKVKPSIINIEQDMASDSSSNEDKQLEAIDDWNTWETTRNISKQKRIDRKVSKLQRMSIRKRRTSTVTLSAISTEKKLLQEYIADRRRCLEYQVRNAGTATMEHPSVTGYSLEPLRTRWDARKCSPV